MRILVQLNFNTTVWEVTDIMIIICSCFSTIAKVCKCINAEQYFSAVSDIELMGVTANVQGIVVVNRSLYWTSYS